MHGFGWVGQNPKHVASSLEPLVSPCFGLGLDVTHGLVQDRSTKPPMTIIANAARVLTQQPHMTVDHTPTRLTYIKPDLFQAAEKLDETSGTQDGPAGAVPWAGGRTLLISDVDVLRFFPFFNPLLGNSFLPRFQCSSVFGGTQSLPYGVEFKACM